jgi:hypothetical protein
MGCKNKKSHCFCNALGFHQQPARFTSCKRRTHVNSGPLIAAHMSTVGLSSPLAVRAHVGLDWKLPLAGAASQSPTTATILGCSPHKLRIPSAKLQAGQVAHATRKAASRLQQARAAALFVGPA